MAKLRELYWEGDMERTKQIKIGEVDEELYMRHLIWVTAILFVMSALANSNNSKFIQPLVLGEGEQAATCGVLVALAAWPKVKKIFGV